MNEHTSSRPSLATNTGLTDIKNHEEELILFIRDRLGIVIHTHQKNDLHQLVMNACNTFHYTLPEYLKALQTAADHSPLIEQLITGITIGETYFFRDANQIRLLQETLLPALVKRKREQNNRTLRIWSAGCASGEEIYTIAMLLCDMLPDIKSWTLNLLGTDINTHVLKKAMQGIYSEWSMRSIPERYKQRYFSIKNSQYLISAAIRDMVNFLYLNLNDNTFPSILNATHAQDLILCRNVLIYFDRERGAKLMQKLSASLVEGGHLVLGASDPVYTADTPLTFNYQQGALFTRQTVTEQYALAKNPAATEETLLLKTARKEHAPASPLKAPEPPPPLPHSTTVSHEEQYRQINQLLKEERWQETLDTIRSYRQDILKSAFLLSAEATALANLGKLHLAAQRCEESLAIDSTSVKTHFMLAMVLVELNRIKEAEAEFRKALFLDHEFVMGHFQLGLLLIKNKQPDIGLKCLNNALTIVKAHPPLNRVSGFDTLTYGDLAATLQHEMELHRMSRGMRNVFKQSEK